MTSPISIVRKKYVILPFIINGVGFIENKKSPRITSSSGKSINRPKRNGI
jgi:hypothetical protein